MRVSLLASWLWSSELVRFAHGRDRRKHREPELEEPGTEPWHEARHATSAIDSLMAADRVPAAAVIQLARHSPPLARCGNRPRRAKNRVYTVPNQR
jgi:hypothetical protein